MICTPRYFWQFTPSSITSHKEYWNEEGIFFSVICIDIHFLGANDICHDAAQSSKQARSCCKALRSSAELIFPKRTQSSANSFMFEEIASGMSLTNSKKSIGTRTVPCGTPDRTGDQREEEPLTTTRCLRSVKKQRSQA